MPQYWCWSNKDSPCRAFHEFPPPLQAEEEAVPYQEEESNLRSLSDKFSNTFAACLKNMGNFSEHI